VQAIDLGREPYKIGIKEAMQLALDKMAKLGEKGKKESSDSSDDEDLYDRLDELEALQKSFLPLMKQFKPFIKLYVQK
jgi:hypothetical protein